MKCKIVFNHDKPIFENTNGYFDNCIASYKKWYKAELLFWILFDESNYFTVNIKDDPVYKSTTPFLYVHRTKETPHRFDNDFEGDVEKYPYALLTLGCDDGNKGYRFETKEKLNEFLNVLMQDITPCLNKDLFENVYEFWDYYYDYGESFSN